MLNYVANYTPRRAHPTDAGLDLIAANAGPKPNPLDTNEELYFPAHTARLVGTGFRAQLSTDTPGVILLLPRSSLFKKSGGLILANSVGVVDYDYTGEIFANLYNTSNKPLRLPLGQPIVQILTVPIFLPELNKVAELEDTQRGSGGFGSTDK